jgi:hypothetical protein
VAVVEVHGPIAAGAPLLHLGGRQAKQEEILRPDLLADLDVGPVHRAYRQRPVHLELHVAGARGFLACGRDLLRQVRRRIDALAVGDVEVRQEDDFDQLTHSRVAIDDVAHRRDQADHHLRQVIARRRLAAEDEYPRMDLEARIGLEAVIQPDHVQDVQMLALVFMDALDVHVEDGIGVDHHAGALADDQRPTRPCSSA